MKKIIKLIKTSCNIAYNTAFNTYYIAKEVKIEEYSKVIIDFYKMA